MAEAAPAAADRSADLTTEDLLATLDHAGIGYALTDADGHGLLATDAFIRLLATPREALICGRPWYTLDHANDDEKRERARLWTAFTAKGEPWNGWVRWRQADGTVRHFEGTSRPLPDGRVLLVSVDRSHERAADRAAQHAADMQRRILDDLPVSVALQERDGTILYCNRFVPERLGVAPEAVIGRHPRDVPFLGLDENLIAMIGDARAAGQAVDGAPLAVKDGPLAGTHWLIYSRPLYDRRGAFSRFLTIGVDRTARASLEAEREAFAKALAETQKIDALNDFAGSLAHELANILHPAGVYARALADRPDHPERAAFAATIKDAVVTAGGILRRTLTMARSEAAPPGRLDVGALLEEVTRSARDLAPSELRYELGPLPASTIGLAEPTELRQVLLNLLNNAADAQGRSGTVRIEAEAGIVPPKTMPIRPAHTGAFLAVSVIDEGCGMSNETTARIFEPFFTTKGRGEGTGLGLPVVRGLVTGWGGAVSVRTKLGEGSRFTVWIPMPRDEEPAAAKKDDAGVPTGRGAEGA